MSSLELAPRHVRTSLDKSRIQRALAPIVEAAEGGGYWIAAAMNGASAIFIDYAGAYREHLGETWVRGPTTTAMVVCFTTMLALLARAVREP